MSNAKSPDDGDVVRVELPPHYQELTTAGIAFRLRDATDYVYFVTGGEVTMPEGLLYSDDQNALPEILVSGGDPGRINAHWWFGAIPAAYLEAGRLE